MKPIALWRRRNMDVIKDSEVGDNVGVGMVLTLCSMQL
jgi:hypothetical protein